jgi:hypothetical protein
MWLVTHATRDARPFDTDEFRGGGERAGLDPATAAEHARAVNVTRGEAPPPKGLSDLLAGLPRGCEDALLDAYEPTR